MSILTELSAGGFLILTFWLWWVIDDYDKLSKDYNTATNTADCLLPYIPEQMTWGESLMLNISLLSVIEQCNSDKKAIREIEENR